MEFFVFTGYACFALLALELYSFIRAGGARRPAVVSTAHGPNVAAAHAPASVREFDRAA